MPSLSTLSLSNCVLSPSVGADSSASPNGNSQAGTLSSFCHDPAPAHGGRFSFSPTLIEFGRLATALWRVPARRPASDVHGQGFRPAL